MVRSLHGTDRRAQGKRFSWSVLFMSHKVHKHEISQPPGDCWVSQVLRFLGYLPLLRVCPETYRPLFYYMS
jgi:hypothetical protein